MLVEITIPVHNEEKILEDNIKKLLLFLKKVYFKYNVTIAENGSSDNTLEIARKLAKKYKNVRMFYTDKLGKGNAIKQVWKKSKAELLCFMDADLSTDLKHVPEMIKYLKEYDVVVGNRLYKESKTKRNIGRTIFSKGYNYVLKFYLKTKINDMQCGFKGIRKNVFLKLINKTKNDGFFFDTELMVWAEKRGYKIKEIPVNWKEGGQSKVNITKTVRNFLTQVYYLRERLRKEGLL